MSRTTRGTARSTRQATRSTRSNGATSSTKEVLLKQEEGATPAKRPRASRKRAASTPSSNEKTRKIKREADDGLPNPSPSKSPSPSPQSATTPKSKRSTAEQLQAKKLQSYAQFAAKSPFPDFFRPSPSECKLAHRILISLHGPRNRPKEVIASTTRAGCGDSPSVLDALVRTILSQNTSDTNSTRAKQNMDKVYGRSDKWEAIVEGGQTKLQDAIKSGGLSVVKSKVIISILKQSFEKYGEYSLDHLHEASSEDAMREMLSFQGVGPKTASCVLLFCLQRESFAVDTHVWRITGLLGWRPKTASRDETHAHLDVMITDED
jgi:endonuclease-3